MISHAISLLAEHHDRPFVTDVTAAQGNWRQKGACPASSVLSVHDNYTYRVQWSSDLGQYLARCLEIEGLFSTGMTAQEALANAEQAVEAYLRESEEVFGAEPPKAFTEHNFSGRFMVRTSRSLHARLMIEATEQRVSFNQWVVQKLIDRKPSLDW